MLYKINMENLITRILLLFKNSYLYPIDQIKEKFLQIDKKSVWSSSILNLLVI